MKDARRYFQVRAASSRPLNVNGARDLDNKPRAPKRDRLRGVLREM